MDYSIGDFFSSVIKLFALLTPPAALSAFLSGTQTYGGRRKRRTALRTGTAVFIVGTVLYFFGESLFSVFGFTLDAFRIGAGALLFLTSVALMGEQRESHTPDSPDEDISVVPLTIPICMGPASIGTLMVLGASAHSMTERIIGSAALFVASALITLMLLMANHVQRILGKTGLAVLSKLTGLLLAAIAAQVVFTGVKNFLIVDKAGRDWEGESFLKVFPPSQTFPSLSKTFDLTDPCSAFPVGAFNGCINLFI
ncbi:MAG: MarC family protein [Bilophila wadsworthia]